MLAKLQKPSYVNPTRKAFIIKCRLSAGSNELIVLDKNAFARNAQHVIVLQVSKSYKKINRMVRNAQGEAHKLDIVEKAFSFHTSLFNFHVNSAFFRLYSVHNLPT